MILSIVTSLIGLRVAPFIFGVPNKKLNSYRHGGSEVNLYLNKKSVTMLLPPITIIYTIWMYLDIHIMTSKSGRRSNISFCKLHELYNYESIIVATNTMS
jgi:hypothetical protein